MLKKISELFSENISSYNLDLDIQQAEFYRNQPPLSTEGVNKYYIQNVRGEKNHKLQYFFRFVLWNNEKYFFPLLANCRISKRDKILELIF